jgi:hypothetical protein
MVKKNRNHPVGASLKNQAIKTGQQGEVDGAAVMDRIVGWSAQFPRCSAAGWKRADPANGIRRRVCNEERNLVFKKHRSGGFVGADGCILLFMENPSVKVFNPDVVETRGMAQAEGRAPRNGPRSEPVGTPDGGIVRAVVYCGFSTRCPQTTGGFAVPWRYSGGNQDDMDHKGFWVIKRQKARKRLSRTLKKFWAWCQAHLHLSVGEQFRQLSLILRGRFHYYGICANDRMLGKVFRYAERASHYRLGRRSQKTAISWERFGVLREAFPLPKPSIVHGNI